MKELGLTIRIYWRKKYKSYMVDMNKKSPNIIERAFEGLSLLKSAYRYDCQIVLIIRYLPPVMGDYNSKILSPSPKLVQVKAMDVLN